MSYKVMSHSLADKTANLADVYASVRVLPLAKAQILQTARTGLPDVEGLSATDIASLVDGFILYRYGWWDDVPTAVTEKTLKQAFKQSWQQRKVRPKYDDEEGIATSPRTIRGRSSSIPVLPIYDFEGKVAGAHDAGFSITTAYFSVDPVYADGSTPQRISGYLTQSAAQESMFACTIVTGTEASPIERDGGRRLRFEVSVNGATSPYIPASSEGAEITLVFTLVLSATESPVDSTGNKVVGAGETQATQQYTIYVDLREADYGLDFEL